MQQSEKEPTQKPSDRDKAECLERSNTEQRKKRGTEEKNSRDMLPERELPHLSAKQ